MPLPQETTYTLKDIYALPDGQRAELIDGRIYDMAPPSARHQDIIFSLSRKIADYIDTSEGNCKIYLAPYAVFLNADDKNYVEPDISVICDKSKLNDKGCHGAPDWIIEVVSPSTERMDYGIKLFKYRSSGVREYWIINPMMHTVNVYDLEHENQTRQYHFTDTIPVCIYEGLHISIADLLP
ncbi:MAG: Uma2 family endonuclease [Lachnospiraceae bacterium]|nr:Uma2 family endonuclease [Lachnospiraceae bacterium]